MLRKLASQLPLFLTLFTSVLGDTYTLSDNFVGQSFFNEWTFQDFDDPTHGRVNYVDQNTAQRLRLASASSNSFVMRADSTTVLDPDGPGRNSVRIQSNKRYGASVVVWNIRHMPEGCGTWPAAWTTGPDWPNQGEIDIVEGVNNQVPNLASLHTSAGCTMPSGGRDQSGQPTSNDCQGHLGCSVKAPTSNSFGPAFNRAGGGIYAMERSNEGIRMWFWPLNDPSTPPDISRGSNTVNPDGWPTPFADFPSTHCDISDYFGAHNIVFDLTFCGDWAGNSDIYGQSGCPSSCTNFVNNNPSAFANAYWDIAYVRVFE